MTSLTAIYGESLLQVFFVTCILGGGAAWMAGHTLANNWLSFAQTFFYLLLLGAAVRFVHFALFQSSPFSLPAYLADTAFLLLVGGISWRLARVKRMVRQYRWLYERSSPFTWRERTQQTGKN
jgi:FtsH-binding integral membrane protein